MHKEVSFFVFALLCVASNVSFTKAIVCYKCDSLLLEACAMSLDETDLPIEECKSSTNCIMSIVDSVTYRGCGSDTPTIGSTYKKTCSTNLCNKGVFPPGRLKCFQCSGVDCVERPEGKPHPCLTHREIDECYTEVIDDQNVHRGCRSDTNRTTPDAEVAYCDENGCNNRPGMGKLKCVQCDSDTDRGCKMDLSSINLPNCNITQFKVCEVTVPLTQRETCFHYHHLDHVVRGCTRYIPESIKLDDQHRTECDNGDLCNASCMKQQICLVCDSTAMKDCRSESPNVAKSVCGSPEVSSCHSCEYKDWHVKRNCGPAPSNDLDINRCYECDDGETCNRKPLTRCYKCSTDDNDNCANWDQPFDEIQIEECEHVNTSCLMAAFPNVLVVRGCQSDNFTCNDTMINCHQCHGSFCNKDPYPPGRLRCYQCSSAHECTQLNGNALPCPALTQDEREACFEYYNAEGNGMIRGCRSNTLAYFNCIFYNNGKNCRVCYEDGCNNTPALGA